MKADLPLSQDQLCGLSRELLEGMSVAAQQLYGDSLVSLAVYGSVGRGDLHEDSDVDILLVASDLPGERWERWDQWDRLEEAVESSFCYFKDQGWNWSLSPVIKTPSEVKQGSPLFLDMTEDCKIVLDRESFLESYLSDLRKKLADQGARRIWCGRNWYWDLQPDFDPKKKVYL